MKKSVSGQVMKFSPKLATKFFDDFFTYNNSCPPFRAPCVADFLMEFKRGHCTDAPFPLHREKMVMGMDMDMDVGIAMVMGEVGSQFEKRPKKVLKKVLKESAKKSSHSESTKNKLAKLGRCDSSTIGWLNNRKTRIARTPRRARRSE